MLPPALAAGNSREPRKPISAAAVTGLEAHLSYCLTSYMMFLKSFLPFGGTDSKAWISVTTDVVQICFAVI